MDFAELEKMAEIREQRQAIVTAYERSLPCYTKVKTVDGKDGSYETQYRCGQCGTVVGLWRSWKENCQMRTQTVFESRFCHNCGQKTDLFDYEEEKENGTDGIERD